VERGFLRGTAGDAGDDLPGDLAELDVAVLGGGAEQFMAVQPAADQLIP
jgi:hypothetical protein